MKLNESRRSQYRRGGRLVVALTACLLAVGMTTAACWNDTKEDDERDVAKQGPTDGESTDDETGDEIDGDEDAEQNGTSLEEVDASFEPAFNERSFDDPVWAMQFPGHPDRWFVIEQPGRIITFDASADGTDKTVWGDISGRVQDGGERGLLGMAIHPDWPNERTVYLSYTTNDPGELTSRISAFQVDAPGDGGVGSFQADSEEVLLTIEQPYSNHNGGQITFGPDGYLYAGYGDGGAGGDPEDNGQDPTTLLGSMLRIDPTTGDPYGIPEDNPFAGDGIYETDEGNTVEGAEEVFAWGLRNPWRWSFDPKSGELWAGDVGQNAWEEIDIIDNGENYGWNPKEGTHCYEESPCEGPYEEPVVDYGREVGKSVTGGYVYRGDDHPELQGTYLFADYLSGRVWGIPNIDDGRPYSMVELMNTDYAVSSFARGLDGEVYLIDYGGTIYDINIATN